VEILEAAARPFGHAVLLLDQNDGRPYRSRTFDATIPSTPAFQAGSDRTIAGGISPPP